MKVKDSVNILNKKKNALPSSKLLKPKKFKSSLKKSGGSNKPPLNKGKLKVVNKNINLVKLSSKIKRLKNSSDFKEGLGLVSLASSPKKLNKASPANNFSKLSDAASQEQKGKGRFRNNSKKNTPESKSLEASHKQKKKGGIINKNKKNTPESKSSKPSLMSFNKQESSKVVGKNKSKGKEKTGSNTGSPKHSLKANKVPLSQETNKTKVIEEGTRKKIKNKPNKKPVKVQRLPKVVDQDQNKENEASGINKCKLKTDKVAAITQGLLKLINETSSSKPEMLDVGEPVFLQVDCIKIPVCATKQLRFKLPHPLYDETSDVLLITADLKGHKIYPDRAVDHYEELFARHQINFITKVMPFRMVKKEYSQYELKRKLVDQFDLILADSRIIKSLPAILGKFILYKRKMPIPVNLTIGEQKLKKHLQDAVCKTQMTVKSNGHSSVVQIGHSKMAANEIAANVVEVAKSLEPLYPGGWRNVRSLVIKTTKSTSLPVYLSLLSPNAVKTPVEIPKKPAPVEGELSTMPGYNVIVTASGKVILKKVEEDLKIDNSRDDEILEEAEKYLQSSKTVRYDDSSDEEKPGGKEDSDDEGDAITEAMEKKLMNKYEKNVKSKKNKQSEEEEEEESEEGEESEEESEIVPMLGKKRKKQVSNKQSGPPAKKKTKAVEPKGKNNKDKSAKDSKKTVSPGFKKPQARGTRGGKKNKMSKDQRKALIKRRKAGKK